jgi:type II secretory pathway pseudopilin PulG
LESTEVFMHRLGPRSAFSFIEIVLVVAIVTIISVIGYGSIQALLPRYRTRQAALSFASMADQLRTMAIVNNREYRIYLDSYDPFAFEAGSEPAGIYWLQAGNRASGSTSWDTLPLDADDGSDDSWSEGRVDISKGGEDEIPGVSIVPWAVIVGPNHGAGAASNNDAIVFSPRGWVTNPNSDFGSYGDGYIRVEFLNKRAYREGRTEIYAVRIARTGFARVDYSPTSMYAETAGMAVGTEGTSTSAGGGS